MNVEALKIERRPSQNPRKRRRNPWFGRIVALSILAGLGWLFHAPVLQLVDRLRLPLVQIWRVVESHPAAAGAVRGAAANGHIVAARRAALSADTAGLIVEINVTEGSVVKKGDVVARLYSDEYAADLRRREADLESATVSVKRLEVGILSAEAELDQRSKTVEAGQEAVAEAKANHVFAQDEFTRVADLVERGISSGSAYDAAKSGLDTTSAQLRGAEARLRAAEAGVTLSQSRVRVAEVDLEVAHSEVHVREAARDQAVATLEKTEVRAPFDGIVILKNAEVGEVVSPNSQGGSNARGSVCTMVALDSLEVQAEVPETSLSAVEQDGSASIYLDAYPEITYTGHVDRIWPTANRQKGTIEVRIRFDHPDGRLRPEMGVRVVFGELGSGTEGDSDPVILIPEDAVVEIDGRTGVFFLERDVVRFREVDLGESRSGRITVSAGLQPGQNIVANPPLSLQPGDRVRIQEG